MSTHAKSIQYSPDTRDFAMYLDGELVGFAATYQKAEQQLDALVYEILTEAAAQMTEEAPVSDPTPEPQPEIPTPAQVAAACQALAEEFDDAAAAHADAGNADAAKDLRSAARAARKAAFHALAGVQVARWLGDDLLVNSATDHTVHTVKASGCSCTAGIHARNCWHLLLRCGWERAMEGIEADAEYALAA